MKLTIALGCFALAIVFTVQAVASLRRGLSVMGLMTAVTAASIGFIGLMVLWGWGQ